MNDTIRNVIGKRLTELGKINNNIFVVDCDMAKHTKLDSFFENFPDRSIQLGICEQNAISVAAGIASEGKIVVVSSFAAFIAGRSWEQIRHCVAYNDNHVIIIGTHSGLSAAYDGGSHQSLEDLALMTSIPNMNVFSPMRCDEAAQMIEFAINNPGAYYIRIGRDEVKYNLSSDYKFKFGDPVVLNDAGNTKTAIVTTGEIGNEVLEAYSLLLKNNLKIKLIHIPTIKPLNGEKLKEILNGISNLLVVEEHSQFGGLSSIISLQIINKTKIKKFETINVNSFGETGSYTQLKNFFKLNSKNIVNKMLKMEEDEDEIN